MNIDDSELAFHRAAIECFPDCVFWIVESGHITRSNRTAELLYDYTAEEFRSLKIHDLISAESEFNWSDIWREATESGTVEVSARHRALDGRVFPVEMSLRAAPGVGDTVCVFVRDITERESELDAHKERSERLHIVLDNAVEAIVVINARGIVQSFNRAAESIFGYASDEIIGENVKVLMPSEHSYQHDDYLKNYMSSGKKNVIGTTRVLKGIKKCGDSFPIELSVSEAKLDSEFHFVGFVRDISERVEANARYAQAMSLLKSLNEVQRGFVNNIDEGRLFDSLLTSVLEQTKSEYGFIGEVLEKDGVPYLKTHAITNIAWNDETRAFYDANVETGLEFHNLDTLFGHVILHHTHVISNSPSDDPRSGGLPPDHPAMNSFLGLPFVRGDQIFGMIGLANSPGGYNDALAEYLDPLLVTCTGLIQGYRDRFERIRLAQELSELAQFDALTGLANRRLFSSRLDESLKRTIRYEENLVLAYLDLDHFKQVNDNYGHHIGDVVLVGFAELLSGMIRDTDLACRLGGEEFAIILTCAPANVARVIMQRILGAMQDKKFNSEDGDEFRVTCSCGIVHYSDKVDAETLNRRADEALYAAKEAGRNRICVYGE